MKKFKLTDIGINSGRIWRELEERACELSIQELCRKLSMSFEEAVLSIGWLAKEDNITIQKREGRLMLSKKKSDFSWG